MNLKPDVLTFISEYMSNGNNATQAYLVAKPNVTIGSAKVSGHKMLTRPNVQAEIAQRIERRELESTWTHQESTARTRQVMAKADQADKLDTVLKAIDTLNKTHDHYSQNTPDHAVYQTFINQLFVGDGAEPGDTKSIEQNSGDVIEIEAHTPE